MKTADKQKMCSNCHGRIPVEAEACPYCGQEQMEQLLPESSSQATLFEQQSLQDSLTSLYSPPYPSKRAPIYGPAQTPKTAPLKAQVPVRKPLEPKSPFAPVKEERAAPQEEEGVESASKTPTPSSKESLWALILMILGGNIFTLGLVQLFFGENSRLCLEWKTAHWYLYCLAALPLLFVGYRFSSKLKN